MTRLLALFLLAACAIESLSAQVLTFGTIASEGSVWHRILQQMSQDWRRISQGKINMRIHGSGVQGTELEMLQRVRFDQLQGLMISNVDLPHVDRSTTCLQIPMMFDSFAELDYVRERIAPKLEQRIAAKGFIVLNWGDVGWVHFFSRKPVKTLAEIKRMKLLTAAGDPESDAIYKQFGFHTVPMAYTEMLMAIQTGKVDVFDVPPLFAMLNQSFALANNMIDLKWSPLIGATIISTAAWNRLPAEVRPQLKEAAAKAGLRLRDEVRKLGDDAVVEMQKRKLSVIALDNATRESWRKEVEASWPKLRGSFVEAALFDEVLRLRDEFRKASR